MFGLNFGELFIVGFVFFTVVGAPYAGPVGERLFGWLMPKGATAERAQTAERDQTAEGDQEVSSSETTNDSEKSKGSEESGG